MPENSIAARKAKSPLDWYRSRMTAETGFPTRVLWGVNVNVDVNSLEVLLGETRKDARKGGYAVRRPQPGPRVFGVAKSVDARDFADCVRSISMPFGQEFKRSRGRGHSLPPRGTKLPVPMPMSTTTTNRAAIEEPPQGIQIAKTTARVKTFIMMVALRGPTTRSESQGGRVRPSTAPLWMFSRQGRDGTWTRSKRGETHMLYDIIK